MVSCAICNVVVGEEALEFFSTEESESEFAQRGDGGHVCGQAQQAQEGCATCQRSDWQLVIINMMQPSILVVSSDNCH